MKIFFLTILSLSMLIACSKPNEASTSNTKQKVSTGISAKHMEKYNYFKTLNRKNIMEEQFIRQVETYMKYKHKIPKNMRTDYQQHFIDTINEILADLKC